MTKSVLVALLAGIAFGVALDVLTVVALGAAVDLHDVQPYGGPGVGGPRY